MNIMYLNRCRKIATAWLPQLEIIVVDIFHAHTQLHGIQLTTAKMD